MSANLFMIYQINDLVKSRDYRCRPYEYQIENGFMVTSENYVLGYKASLIQGVTPGQIRERMEKLNIKQTERARKDNAQVQQQERTRKN